LGLNPECSVEPSRGVLPSHDRGEFHYFFGREKSLHGSEVGVRNIAKRHCIGIGQTSQGQVVEQSRGKGLAASHSLKLWASQTVAAAHGSIDVLSKDATDMKRNPSVY
jgi:hypothetical protein